MSTYKNTRIYREPRVDNQSSASWTRYQPRNFDVRTTRQPRPDKRFFAILGVILVSLIIAATAWFGSGVIEKGDTPGVSPENQSTPQTEWQKGVMPNLYQTDAQWRNHPYAEATFGESGCGPISLTMAYIFLTGDRTISPTTVSDMAQRLGYASLDGTSWEFMTVGANQLGLHAEETLLNETTVREHLISGHPIICIMGRGDFTSNGHFIVLSDITEDGLVTVHDSNSAQRSSKLWSLETIQEQHRNAWVYRT